MPDSPVSVYAAPFPPDFAQPAVAPAKEITDARLAALEYAMQLAGLLPPPKGPITAPLPSECPNTLNALADYIKEWREGKGFDTSWHSVPEKLMLIVTELAEAMEAYRHFTREALNHLELHHGQWPSRTGRNDSEPFARLLNFKEELADTLIRLLDLTASLGIDIEYEVAKKMAENRNRPTKHNKER